MSLIGLVIVLAVVGVLLFFINRAPFIDATIKQVIFWVVMVVVALWLINLFVGFGDLETFRIGRVR